MHKLHCAPLAQLVSFPTLSSVGYSDQLFCAACQIHVVYSDQLLGAAGLIHLYLISINRLFMMEWSVTIGLNCSPGSPWHGNLVPLVEVHHLGTFDNLYSSHLGASLTINRGVIFDFYFE